MPTRKYHRTVGQRIDREPGPVVRVPENYQRLRFSRDEQTAVVVVAYGRVTRAPEPLGWAVGRPLGELVARATREGWQVPATVPPMGPTVRYRPTDRG